MVVLGVLIIAAAAVVAVTMVARGDDSVTVDLDSVGTFDTDAGMVFLLGALTLLVAVLGLVIMRAGMKRSRRRRAEVRDLKSRARHAEATRTGGTTSSDTARYDDGGADSRTGSAPPDR